MTGKLFKWQVINFKKFFAKKKSVERFVLEYDLHMTKKIKKTYIGKTWKTFWLK